MGKKEAKVKGVYKGRRQIVDVAKIKELASEGLIKTEIAKRLGIGRATVYVHWVISLKRKDA